MVVLLSLLSAASFALGTVLQQRGTMAAEVGAEGVHFLAGLLRRPVWLLGGLVTAVGWVLQAFALHRGSLVVVQSLATLSLVIALPFGARLTGQRITRRVWAGAAAFVTGVVLVVSVGSPQSGTGTPGAGDWWPALLVSGGLIAVLSRLGTGRPAGVRAVLLGTAAGTAYGLQAGLTKVLTDVLADGVPALLSSWELYVLIAAGFVGLAVGQGSLRTGVLAPAMAATTGTTLFASIALGVTVFGERFGGGGGHGAAVFGGLALALVGVVLLAAAPQPVTAPVSAAPRAS